MRISSGGTRSYSRMPRNTSEAGVVARWPVSTLLLIAILVAVFAVEVHLAPPGEDKGLSPYTQIMVGGLTGNLAHAGQWYRLLSSAFLHANPRHLIMNAIALGLVGYALERIVGHAWVVCIFAMGAVCGGLASVLMLPSSTVTVGASGGIMALLGALYMTSFRVPRSPARWRIQSKAIYFGVPGLIPHHATGSLQTNYAAHFGGAIFGILIGGLLLAGWESFSTRPPHAHGATVLATVALLAAGFSAYGVSSTYGAQPHLNRFIPPASIPKKDVDMIAHGDALAIAFPDDARAHVFAGMAHLSRMDKMGAEGELETALRLDASEPGLYSRTFMNTVHVLLATLFSKDGRPIEAIAMAQPFCRQPNWTQQSPRLVALVRAGHLCS